MPEGLTNAPTAFQRFMNNIFVDMIDVNVIVYLDGILVYSDDLTEHKCHVREVLWRLHANSLFVTSSSSYSKSLEIKAGNSEVRRVPGNGFSSCTAPTFSRVQGISNGGRNRFPECAGTESVPERFRVRVRRREKRRFGVCIVRRCAECAR